MILRVQSRDGTKRVSVQPADSVSTLLSKIQTELNLENGWKLYGDRERTQPVVSSPKSLGKLNFKHGDMLYVVTDGSSVDTEQNDVKSKGFQSQSLPGFLSPAALASEGSSAVSAMDVDVSVVEDEVDTALSETDGKIYRSPDEKYCRHGAKGKCIHCSPVEPWDEEYLMKLEPPIKHMSFHAYLRKLMRGVDRGKFAPLENITCSIKPGCTEHPPWPNGICTKCQPNAVTLSRQAYRHVDNISFENKFLVDRFLNYWRSTGNQRLGYLYGRYETYKDVPLGIRATVCAIYEPPQESDREHIQLVPDPREDVLEWVASGLGLTRVGWIFTDLVPEDRARGTVKHTRHAETVFLSGEECMTAATFQNQHPNICKHSPDSHFGSKFVTVIVTGDVSNQIHFEGYQVSNQCMALVRDGCLLPTLDTPEFCYVKPSTNEQYVPDVFFKKKDGYGNEVTHTARCFPVDYLLVDIPTAMPVEQQFTFVSDSDVAKAFPVENRLVDGQVQDFNALSKHFEGRNLSYRDTFYDAISDFHLLLYLSDLGMHPMKEHMSPLLESVKEKDAGQAYSWSKHESWCTLVEIMKAHGCGGASDSPGSPGPAPGAGSSMWPCQHCTYLNQGTTDTCEVCRLPK